MLTACSYKTYDTPMAATGSAPSLESLLAWQATLVGQAEDLRTSIRAMQADLAKVEERMSLVTKLIEVETGVDVDTQSNSQATAEGPTKAAGEKGPTVTADLELAVEEILRAAGQPMHIADIRANLIDQGVPIPGRGDDANIIVRLRRLDDRFTRTARGTYALAEWGLPALPNKKSQRRRTAVR